MINISQMSIFNIKSACSQGLKSRFYLPTFFIKRLSYVWFIKGFYYLQLSNILLVEYFGCEEITKLPINLNSFGVKRPLINSEDIKQPLSLYPLSVGRFLYPAVPTNTNIILNV